MKKTANKASNPLASLTAGVVKVAESILVSDKIALPVKEQWEAATKGKTPEEIKGMISVIDEAAKATMGIVKGDDTPETNVKRAALSRALKAIGITRRTGAPKGDQVKESHIQAVLTYVAKLEKDDKMQRKLVRAVYDRLLKSNDKK